MPATIIYREKTITGASGATGATGAPTKGTPLTNLEIDNNFYNLTTEVDTKLGATGYNAADVLTKIKTVDGAGSGLDADTVDGLNPTTGWTGASGATGFTGVNIVARDALGNFTAGTITANLVGTVTGSVSGNAGTVTNGVVTSGSYANPAWITSLAGSKITSLPNTSLANSSITVNGQTIALGASGSILGVTQTWTGTQTFIDSAFVVIDNLDSSKKLNLQLSTVSTNTTRTLNVPNESGTIATTEYVTSQLTSNITWQGTQNFTDSKFVLFDEVDTTKKLNFQLSGISNNTTRVLTIPNASGTVALESYVTGITNTIQSNITTLQNNDTTLQNNINAVVTAKGFISFYPPTGGVYASRNLSVTRHGAGDYTITLASGIRTGNEYYAPLVGAIGSENAATAATFNANSIDQFETNINTVTSSSFKVSANRNYNAGLGFAGGNDGNNAQLFVSARFDPARITVVVY